MYSILPFILILFSLTVIIIVIVRKFPQLTLLDVDSIPEVKMGKKKDEFLKKKAEKQAQVSVQKQKEMLRPLFNRLKGVQVWFRKIVLGVYKKTLDSVENKKRNKRIASSNTPSTQDQIQESINLSDDIKKILEVGNKSLQDDDLETAENKFISAIRLDSKNVDAYFGLASVYIKKEEWVEACDTLGFSLKISPDNTRVLIALAGVYEKIDDLDKAVECYEKAVIIDDSQPEIFAKVGDLLLDINQCDNALEAMRQASELEPENQDYLDKLVDISVKCGNKELADEFYQKLRMLDPENSRLAVLRAKIDSV